MFGDVLCLSHLRWGFVFQRPNHLMSRFARERRVFFIEEPYFDSTGPRLEVSRVERGLHVVVPHLPSGTPAERIDPMLRTLLDALILGAEVDEPLLWFYTPMAIGWARHVEASGVVYDCMDELSHFAGAHSALQRNENELFTLADVVFTGGRSLYEAKRSRHPRVHAFPSSVDAAHFAEARTSSLPEPEDQRAIPHPRLGYFGVIDERIDLDLIRRIAEARPDFQLVMLGPIVKIDPRTLPRRPNIHWLGQKLYPELPSYVAGWDAAIMPFARNDATKFISPTKTLEYLAAARPVVSTSIHDVVSPYGDEGHVRIADEPYAFAAAVDAALKERGTPAHLAHGRARDAMLARTSWDRTWDGMKARIIEALRRREPRGTTAVVTEEKMPCSTI